MRNILKTSIFLISFISSANFAFALPENGFVTEGKITITKSDKTTEIKQTSNKGIIDWASFNVATDEKVNFNQPSEGASTINRIHDINPSSIEGKITANGQITLVNPNGIFFGKNSKIDVAGIVASTEKLDKYRFREDVPPSTIDPSIINYGDILITNTGEALLISTNIVNHGNIVSQGGKITLLAIGDGVVPSIHHSGTIKTKSKENYYRFKDEYGPKNDVIFESNGNIFISGIIDVSGNSNSDGGRFITMGQYDMYRIKKLTITDEAKIIADGRNGGVITFNKSNSIEIGKPYLSAKSLGGFYPGAITIDGKTTRY